ncbi:AEC family transporter [Stutzerimonas tarimensis]|uniref:AEC family transporter n=1 Tax=Stutzerimonas tarimensis TaxID=1507735 RepID=A0ABV7T4B9_9GAMM
MTAVLEIILPIFVLILLGYLGRRTGRLGPTAASELNRFVVWFGLPAMLINVTAGSDWEQLWQPEFVAAFTAGCIGVFLLTLFYRFWQTRSLADASVDALSASYANTGYMGIPLCLLLFGDEGLQPALVASLIVVCVLFALAIACLETGLNAGQSPLRTLITVVKALARNPMVVSPLLGLAWSFSGAPMPKPVGQVLTLLGAATVPCALVSLGLFLAREQRGGQAAAWPLVGLKLIVQPAITAFFAFRVFQLPTLWASAALLLSALPTGTGPFMLAEYYDRGAALAARVILLSTLGGLLTLSACLYLLGF